MWAAIRSAQLDPQDDQEDEIIWILEGSGKYSASLICGSSAFSFPKTYMESLGTAAMQSFSLVALERPAMGSSPFAGPRMEKQLFLCTLREEPGDKHSSFH